MTFLEFMHKTKTLVLVFTFLAGLAAVAAEPPSPADTAKRLDKMNDETVAATKEIERITQGLDDATARTQLAIKEFDRAAIAFRATNAPAAPAALPEVPRNGPAVIPAPVPVPPPGFEIFVVITNFSVPVRPFVQVRTVTASNLMQRIWFQLNGQWCTNVSVIESTVLSDTNQIVPVQQQQ